MERIGNKIVGSWRLVSWVYENEKGEVVKYFGQAPEGLLMYSETGYMSVQIAQEDRKPFASAGFDTGTKDEMAAAFPTYFAYYGRYEETEAGVYKHTVDGTMFPNWLGNTEIRYAKLEGDKLVLSSPPTASAGGTIQFKISWERV